MKTLSSVTFIDACKDTDDMHWYKQACGVIAQHQTRQWNHELGRSVRWLRSIKVKTDSCSNQRYCIKHVRPCRVANRHAKCLPRLLRVPRTERFRTFANAAMMRRWHWSRSEWTQDWDTSITTPPLKKTRLWTKHSLPENICLDVQHWIYMQVFWKRHLMRMTISENDMRCSLQLTNYLVTT